VPTIIPSRKTDPDALAAAHARLLAARSPLGADEDTMPFPVLSTMDRPDQARQARAAESTPDPPPAAGDPGPDRTESSHVVPGRDRLAGLVPKFLAGARFDPGPRPAAVLTAAAVAVAVLVALLTWRSRPVTVTGPPVAPASALVAPPAAASGRSSVPAAPIVVAVSGKVRRPGVVRLPAGARIIDAVEAAGGALPGADLGLLNLARRLSDGELVVVGLPAAAVPPPATPSGSASPSAAGVDGGAATLDLNAATFDQLDGLPGVGPVLAQRIVDYRAAHGRFDSVDQLRDVDGIGEAKFAQLRDKVTV
jgi:competence protein ComEA